MVPRGGVAKFLSANGLAGGGTHRLARIFLHFSAFGSHQEFGISARSPASGIEPPLRPRANRAYLGAKTGIR
jgi:hypothetical protein